MEATLIAQRSIARARQQRVQAWKTADAGHYRSHSRSGAGWYDVTVVRSGGQVCVTCSCPGGVFYRDEAGKNSLCKHAIAAAKRLMRQHSELAAVA